jgi:hypothetical protein
MMLIEKEEGRKSDATRCYAKTLTRARICAIVRLCIRARNIAFGWRLVLYHALYSCNFGGFCTQWSKRLEFCTFFFLSWFGYGNLMTSKCSVPLTDDHGETTETETLRYIHHILLICYETVYVEVCMAYLSHCIF